MKKKITCIYRSPSQNHEQMDSFCFDFNNLLKNINNNRPVNLVFVDFNAKVTNVKEI